MTQNTEQKVRTREEQITDLGSRIFVGMRNHTDSMCEAQRHIDEAEARGAEDERIKSRRGFSPIGWADKTEMRIGKPFACWPKIPRGDTTLTIPLYSQPANVAALEARVKDLEKENARLKTAQFYGHDEAEGGSDDISTFFDDHEPGTILEIDGYRHVNTKWVLWDGNSTHVFDTEEEASAALKREGGA